MLFSLHHFKYRLPTRCTQIWENEMLSFFSYFSLLFLTSPLACFLVLTFHTRRLHDSLFTLLSRHLPFLTLGTLSTFSHPQNFSFHSRVCLCAATIAVAATLMFLSSFTHINFLLHSLPCAHSLRFVTFMNVGGCWK